MHSFNNAKDRTHKHPLRWCCLNYECYENGSRFEFTSDQPKCPKCTAFDYPFVLILSLTHFITPDPKGLIVSQGRRWKMACDIKRESLATQTNQESATGVPELVNCPGCLEYIQKNKVKKPDGKLILAGS